MTTPLKPHAFYFNWTSCVVPIKYILNRRICEIVRNQSCMASSLFQFILNSHFDLGFYAMYFCIWFPAICFCFTVIYINFFSSTVCSSLWTWCTFLLMRISITYQKKKKRKLKIINRKNKIGVDQRWNSSC